MGINKVATRLMPVSQAIAWLSIIKSANASDPSNALYKTLCLTSAFYCGWALYKVYVEGNKKELGQYSMGLTAIATFAQSKYASLGAICLVIVNFALPIYVVMGWSASKLARVVKESESKEAITWAWIFKGYLLSNIVFWCFAFSNLWNLAS
ncbi:hypothetical protein ACA910_009894 [Epithemia clementina (nom. ined.)]